MRTFSAAVPRSLRLTHRLGAGATYWQFARSLLRDHWSGWTPRVSGRLSPTIQSAGRVRSEVREIEASCRSLTHACVKATLTRHVMQNSVRPWARADFSYESDAGQAPTTPDVQHSEGNFKEYDADLRRRKGADADQPHRVTYKKLVRS